MPPDEVQAHPPAESSTAAPLTTTIAAAPAPSTSRPKRGCSQFNSGWISRGFGCSRLLQGRECPYYHDPALREAALAKKRKDSEEKILAQQQRAAPPANLQDDVKPNRNALQSLQPNQVGAASKEDHKSNVPSQQPSSAPTGQPNKFSDRSRNSKRVNKKCRQYSKFGQCKTLGCVYRHVDPPNTQKVQGENADGALTSSKNESPPDTMSHSAVPVQNELKPISPQLPIGTPPPKVQTGAKQTSPQAPIGTPPPQVNSSEQKQGTDVIPKYSLALDTRAVVAEKKVMDSHSPIAYKSIQSLVAGSEPLDKSRRKRGKTSEICRMYKKSGQCVYNKRCHRSHEVVPDGISTKAQPEQPSIQPNQKLTAPTQNDAIHERPPVGGSHNEHSVQPPKKDNVASVHNNVQASTQKPVGPSKLSHQQPPNHINKRFCYAFANSGRCKLGDECPYPHVEQHNSLQREQINRFVAELSKMSRSQDIRQEFAQAPSNTIMGGSQDIRNELPQTLGKSFARGLQDIRQEFAQKHDNIIMRGSQDIRQEFSQAPNNTTLGGSQDIGKEIPQTLSKSSVGDSQDFRREFSQTPDTAFMRGSQDIRQETSTSIDVKSIAAKVTEQAPTKNTKMRPPFQESGNRSFPLLHTAEPSSSRSNFSKGVCNFYSRTGWCRHERDCKYSHVLHPQKLHESMDNGVNQISTRLFENQFTAKPQNDVLQHVTNALNVESSRDHLSKGPSNTSMGNSAAPTSTLPLAGNSNIRSSQAIKEENSLEQLDGTLSARPFKGKSSQRSPWPPRPRKELQHEKKELTTKAQPNTVTGDNNPLTEKSSNNLPVKSGPAAGKNKRKTKKKINWWKSDPSEENSAPTWTYSEAAKLPIVQKAPMQIAKSSYSEVAKFPSQKSSSVQKKFGPTPVREKLFEVPKVLCKPGCKPIEALSYDPRVRTTDLGHGSWDTDYTLISWLENNLKREQRAEIYARYRNYLERGVIPLIALESKRDLKPNVNLSSFSLLPNEIKEMIWRYALIHKRDVRVRLDAWEVKVGEAWQQRNRIFAYTLSAPLLRTCHLSRQIALEHYKIAFGTNKGGEARIHMDFKLDRLFIRHPDPNQLIDISEAFHEIDLCRVRNLGIPMLHWIQGDNDIFFNAIAQFSQLRELSLVVGDSVKDHTFWKGRPICPFIERHLKAIWKERYPGVRSPGVFYQVIDATQAKHWGIDGIGFAGLVCGDTSVEAKWKNRLKRD